MAGARTLFTFATVLGTTVYTYLLKFEDRPASLTGMKALNSLNLLAPITVALLFSVRGWASPSARWSALRSARAKIEGEIFRYRSAVGVYDPKARTTPSPPKTKARRGGGAKKASASPASTGATQLKPRRLFAQRVQKVWSDVAKSEVRNGSLVYPVSASSLCANPILQKPRCDNAANDGSATRSVETAADVEAPEAGATATCALFPGNDANEGRTSKLSAEDYVDERMAKLFANHRSAVPTLARRHQTLQALVFVAPSAAAAVVALGASQFVSAIAAFGSAFSAVIDSKRYEERIRAANAALAELEQLAVWWSGLTLIERRIGRNKRRLVESAEDAVLAEVRRRGGFVWTTHPGVLVERMAAQWCAERESPRRHHAPPRVPVERQQLALHRYHRVPNEIQTPWLPQMPIKLSATRERKCSLTLNAHAQVTRVQALRLPNKQFASAVGIAVR